MKKLKQFLFVNTTNKQTFVKNTFWLFVSEISVRLLKMILIIYAARVLGANGWGVFSYALSVSSLLMIFSDIGLGGLITREIIQKKDGHEIFISTSLIVKTIILFISTILVVLLGSSLSHIPEARVLFPIIALIFFFDASRELGFSINRASEKMEREMIVKTVVGAVILGLGIFFLKAHVEPKSIASAYAIGSGIGCIMIFWMIKKDIQRFLIKADRKLLRTVLQTTWPFAIITLIGSIMGNTDIYMLGIWKSASDIGLYASVQRIQQFIIIIPAMIATASFPLMSRLANENKDQFRTILEQTLALIFIIGIPIIVGGILLGHTIIPLVLGAGYISAVPIFQVLMIMLIASFPLLLLSNAIFAFDKQKSISSAYIFGVLANILFNILLIPKFGAVGSAIATCISTIIVTIVIWIKMKHIQNFSIISKLGKCIIATIIMTLAIFGLEYMGAHIVLILVVSIGVYFSALLLLKEQTILEVRHMLKI